MGFGSCVTIKLVVLGTVLTQRACLQGDVLQPGLASSVLEGPDNAVMLTELFQHLLIVEKLQLLNSTTE